MCACVYVCVCVCVCAYFLFTVKASLTEQNNKCNTRVQVSNGMLWKYFRINDFCLHVKGNHRKNLQAGSCAKECQLNWKKPREVKYNSYKLSKKTPLKARSIATFLLTNLGCRPESAQRQYCRIGTTPSRFAFC